LDVPQGKWAIFESDGSVESNTRFLLALHELSFRGPGSASTKNSKIITICLV